MREARWPDAHIRPVLIPAGDPRVLICGQPPKSDVRVLSEDEYQLLLVGFRAAGGQIEK